MASTTPVNEPGPSSDRSEKQYASIVPEMPNPDGGRLRLQHTISTISNHDMANVSYVVTGDNDEVYNRFTETRKMVITAILSFCSFLAPMSSTTVLSAVPEVAETYGCDGSIINLSNALYMLFMGVSPMFYGPFGNIYGRKWVCTYLISFFVESYQCEVMIDMVSTGFSGECSPLLRLFDRHRPCSESGLVLCLSHIHCRPGNFFFDHWIQRHWRHLQADRARYSVRMVSTHPHRYAEGRFREIRKRSSAEK